MLVGYCKYEITNIQTLLITYQTECGESVTSYMGNTVMRYCPMCGKRIDYQVHKLVKKVVELLCK